MPFAPITPSTSPALIVPPEIVSRNASVLLDKGGNLYQILTPGAFLMGLFLEDYLRVPEPDVFLCKISFKILVDTHTDPLWPGL